MTAEDKDGGKTTKESSCEDGKRKEEGWNCRKWLWTTRGRGGQEGR